MYQNASASCGFSSRKLSSATTKSSFGTASLPNRSGDGHPDGGTNTAPKTEGYLLRSRSQGRALRNAAPVVPGLEQLKDIVADYGMGPGKLVMKWKTPDRIIGRIVELSLARAVKGDVFLKWHTPLEMRGGAARQQLLTRDESVSARPNHGQGE
jgi:hypothetical protein